MIERRVICQKFHMYAVLVILLSADTEVRAPQPKTTKSLRSGFCRHSQVFKNELIYKTLCSMLQSVFRQRLSTTCFTRIIRALLFLCFSYLGPVCLFSAFCILCLLSVSVAGCQYNASDCLEKRLVSDKNCCLWNRT